MDRCEFSVQTFIPLNFNHFGDSMTFIFPSVVTIRCDHADVINSDGERDEQTCFVMLCNFENVSTLTLPLKSSVVPIYCIQDYLSKG